MRRVAVIGSGIAGTAAALAASAAGAEVTLATGGPGATVLAPGALDDVPWEDARGASDAWEKSRRLDLEAKRILDVLGAYDVPDQGAVVATTAGVVRPARGVDRAILDLSPLASATVLVPGFEHRAWDGASLARAWTDAKLARERGLSFAAVPVQLTRRTEERALPVPDLAARHDDPERLAWLAERLSRAIRESGATIAAVVLPAWLGIERSRAAALSGRVGVPCGEALDLPGGPSGLRFESARDRALAAARVRIETGRATSALPSGSEWRVALGSLDTLAADAVVLALGGLIGGGLVYTPSGSVHAAALPHAPLPLVQLALDAPVALAAFGGPLEVPGSLHGAPPESHAWPYSDDAMLDRVGVHADDEGRVIGAPQGLFVAGEIAADRPRTWLGALSQGARAGARAARG